MDEALFASDLQIALVHLYDPTVLLNSPLVDLIVGPNHHGDAARALRDALIKAIDKQRPSSTAPSHVLTWSIYHILQYRYVEQLTQKEVARDLSLSIRQVRRREKEAIRALASVLWERHGSRLQAPDHGTVASGEEPKTLRASSSVPAFQAELIWLRDSMPIEEIDLQDILKAAIVSVEPLVLALKATVDCALPENLPRLAVLPIAMEQAIVAVVTAAISYASAGTLHIRAEAQQRDVRLSFEVNSLRPGSKREEASLHEHLDSARQLLELFGGTVRPVTAYSNVRSLRVDLDIPIAGCVPVLAIDDNADALTLFQHYLSGTHYRLVSVRDPRLAIEVAAGSQCEVIILDVMLPGLNGWEVLGRLRADPRVRDVPIIVCTVLPQEQLAIALGAAAFLRKPLNRQELLWTLDRWVQRTARESQ